MAAKPQAAIIRSFQVGFGDCFLLTFKYGPQDLRHILIDFGTTALPAAGSTKRQPSTHMPVVARKIQEIVGKNGRLTAVVATHRHADHISGFATTNATGRSGEIIRALRPRLVLQPWTEDPDARPDASKATTASMRLRRQFVASLAAMNDIAKRVTSLTANPPAWMGAKLRKELNFLGEDNIANRSAVENLMAMASDPGSSARYLRFGDPSGLERLLPGVKVHVLGPPDLTQTQSTRKQRSRDPQEFWHLVKGAVPLQAAGLAGAGKRKSAGKKAVPAEGRWFRDRLQRLNGQSLLEIVRQLDQQMNNTSLILLFEFNGRKLLFPGDAQLENWSYALQEAKNAGKVQALLAEVDFYKVGHHGSLNATPRKMLWERFNKRKGKQLQTMMSTMSGKHGHRETRTEVPRATLKTALGSQSRLQNTQTLRKLTDLFHETTIV